MSEEIKSQDTNTETTTTQTTKSPVDIELSENTKKNISNTIKTVFEKYLSNNNTYKLLFFSLLVIIVLAAAFLSYFDFITVDTFKSILDTFLNIFSDPDTTQTTTQSVSQYLTSFFA